MTKFCRECGKEISDPEKVCPECGTNLESQISESNQSLKTNGKPQSAKIDDQTMNKSNNFDRSGVDLNKATSIIANKSNVIAIIGICIFLIVICIVIIPTKTITNDVEVAYLGTETYYEKEPYVTQESYQEQEPYQTTEIYIETVPVSVSVPYQEYEYSYFYRDAGTGYWPTIPSGCTCTNYHYSYDAYGESQALCDQLSCRTSTLVTKYRIEVQEQSIQKERPVTKYQTVTKYRDVTNYRDVAKTRDVMKTRIEQQSSEVNWLLGFKTPYSLHLPLISGK